MATGGTGLGIAGGGAVPSAAGAGGVVPAGGATAAGSPGTAATGGQTNQMPEAPARCKPSPGYYADAVSCGFDFTCESGGYYSTYCRLGVDNNWVCTCKDLSKSRSFVIEGAERMDACDASAAACRDDSEVEPTCDIVERSVFDDISCAVTEECSAVLDLGDGVSARTTTSSFAECQSTDGSVYSCGYSRAGELVQYPVSASSSDELCDVFLEFAKSGETPEFSGPPTCTEDSSSVSLEACEVFITCAENAEIGEGVVLRRTSTRSALCGSPVSGVAHCSCSTGDADFLFDANVSAADRNACLAAVGNCAPEVEVEPGGALACKMVQQNAEPQHCNAELECTQPVSIDGKEYVARGPLLLACNQDAAGEPWKCTCATQGSMVAIDLEGERTAWEACTEATTRCQEESGVHLGPPG